MWKIGAEFKEYGGAFIPVKEGEGTHMWDGAKIVPKPKKRGKRKENENAK